MKSHKCSLIELASRNLFRRALCHCCKVIHGDSRELIKKLRVLLQHGHLQEAAEFIDVHAPHVNLDAYRCFLQTCTDCKDLITGRKVQSMIRMNGYVSDPVLGSHMIRMFDACGSLVEAKEAFYEMPHPNVFAWSAVITACTKHGQGEQALDFYQMMQETDIVVDAHTFVAGLKACAMQGAWILGMLVHEQILKLGFDSLLYLRNALIDMYCKCGNLEEALKVFNGHMDRDAVTWNALLTGYTLNLKSFEAFGMFITMYQEGLADTITYVNLLKLCSNTGAMSKGNFIFFCVAEKGLERDNFVVSTSIDFYAKHGLMEDAQCLFEKSMNHDVVTWNAMMVGLSQCNGVEYGYKTLEVFQDMICQNYMLPDSTTYVCVLRACSTIMSVAQTKFCSICIIERGLVRDLLISNALISAYAKCGCPSDAYMVFMSMSKRDAVTWNAMISGYALNGFLDEAFQIMHELQQVGGTPDIGSWNCLIAGYAQQGYGWEALAFFQQMLQEGFCPDRYSFIGIFNACASVGALTFCRLYHLQMRECDLLPDTYVTNALIDMYGKCGSLEMAHKLFGLSSKHEVSTWNSLVAGYAQHGDHQMAYDLVQQMTMQACKPDIITWNAMFAGLVSNGNPLEAFCLFKKMVSGGVQPDNSTYVTMVKGCSMIGALNLGALFHANVVFDVLEANTALCNACMDMYILCGSLRDAICLFQRLHERDRITWNILISGFAMHNFIESTFTYFESMQREGVKPDVITFTSLLSACGHVGFVDKFNIWMTSINKIWDVLALTVEHINCVVDLLGRAGYLSEAENLLMSFLPYTTVVGWTALLNNCKTYGNAKLGNRCFGHILSFDESLHSRLLFFSNIFHNAELLNEFGVKNLRI